MKVFVVILYLILVLCATGQSAQRSEQGLRHFKSSDGTFQFDFAANLIQCEKSPEDHASEPAQKACIAYFPACDESIGKDDAHTIACIAYPRDKHTDTETFEAATFSVAEVKQAAGEKSCLDPTLSSTDSAKDPIVIQGVKFAAFETMEGGMSQAIEAEIYRTFHANKCYQLVISTVTASAAAFDPTPREMTREDWAVVNSSLKHARDSFRFLR